MNKLLRSEFDFLAALDQFTGRHVILFGSADDVKIVIDATGMRSVFYSADGTIVASHALLVEEALGGIIETDDLPFRGGYPGNRTPYPRTRILTPNTLLAMRENQIRRFWPTAQPEKQTAKKAAATVLDSSALALQRFSKGRGVHLTLTAGIDSRTSLAIALRSGVPLRTYTYGNGPDTQIDRALARDLSHEFGIPHSVISEPCSEPTWIRSVEETNYLPHHARWVGSLAAYFADAEEIAVLGNLLEIGRGNYGPARARGAAAPVDAATMAQLHYGKLGKPTIRRVQEYGLEKFFKKSEAAFQAFIDETDFNSVVGLIDPFIQFYWEHRMATWQGVAMGERDFYANPFIPYNSRRLLSMMLGVPVEVRKKNTIPHHMWRRVDERLGKYPTNPEIWPAKIGSRP